MSAETETYFEQLKALFKLEQDEERRQFEVVLRDQSIATQIERGMCWSPLRIVETGYGYGDYPFVILERTKHLDIPNPWSPGKPARLWAPQENEEAFGVIDWVKGHQVKLVFFRDAHPDILDYGKLALQQVYDEQSARLAWDAMDLAQHARNCALAVIRETLLGSVHATPGNTEESFSDATLNPSQQNAVHLILKEYPVVLVHGPPGTGKTTTLVAAAKAIAALGQRILVCAPSNAATDHISLKMHEAGLQVLRAGHPLRMSEAMEAMSAEGQLRRTPEYAFIKECRKQADEYRRMAGKYKRHFGPQEREQRRALQQEARALMKDALHTEKQITRGLFEQSTVVCATLAGSETSIPSDIEFDVLMLDEAAQALDPLSWIPFRRVKRLVLAGDPFQLPPTVKSEKAAHDGLRQTLMERGMGYLPSALLTEQYRMNTQIMAFPNAWFYEGRLTAHPDAAHRSLEHETPVEFVDTAGMGWEEVLGEGSSSVENPEEARFLFRRLDELRECGSIHPEHSVAFIAPYRSQIRLLQSLAEERGEVQAQIQTIDAFQGQERDVVMVSLVRSNDRGEIGFLKDYRRLNVAMTRARKKLILVGDSATLAQDPFFDALIRHCQDTEAYRSGWEWA